MGEKIRDLHSIRIGRCELMIELNEAYEKSRSGRLIHIQNPHFRFLISEQGFLELAGAILHAKSEMDYFKKKGAEKTRREAPVYLEISPETRNAVADFCGQLLEQDIEYRLIEQHERLVTLIVQQECVERYQEFVEKSAEVQQCEYPYGELFHYQFLYGMHPIELLRYKNVYFEIYFQIPCRSLERKRWIPLDKVIQRRVWETEDSVDGIKVIDPVAKYVYRLCWCIFVNEGFSEYDSEYFDGEYALLESPELETCLQAVFFQYTPQLLVMLRNRDYSSIIRDYFSFDQY